MSASTFRASLPALLLGGLVVTSVLAVASARLTGHDPRVVADAPARHERLLRFEDRDDGTVAVRDPAHADTLVAVVPAQQQHFLRSTVRGLMRERKRHGIGPEPAFSLVARADGRLTLQDPTTGRRIDLESFGPTNAALFAALLPPVEGARP
jgi:putative photosynthetic complex assembly protein